MKLFTEEQLLNTVKAVIEYDNEVRIQKHLKALQPIELPSDVEVGKIVLGNSPLMEHRDSGYFAAGAMKYNKWIKEQLENK